MLVNDDFECAAITVSLTSSVQRSERTTDKTSMERTVGLIPFRIIRSGDRIGLDKT